MIFIIRALSQWGKDDEDYDSPTSQDEASDFTKKEKEKKKEKDQKEKKDRPKKKKEKRKKRKKRNERKREKGQCYYLFFHTCASK